MKFKKGDKVKHKYRGYGTFILYGNFTDEALVQFDESSDAAGETLTVSTQLLEKID